MDQAAGAHAPAAAAHHHHVTGFQFASRALKQPVARSSAAAQ